MIKDTIERAKDLVFNSRTMDPNEKLALQQLLTEVRGELNVTDYLNTQVLARLDVYADICNKVLDRLAARSDY